VRNLRRREKQSLHVAEQLRMRAADDAELRLLIADARDAAWAEVAKNIDRTLRIEASRPDLDPDYDRMRTARMQALRLVDLPKLRAQRRSEGAACPARGRRGARARFRRHHPDGRHRPGRARIGPRFGARAPVR
jgi:hypothetical protein